ncbi:MAG: hypothetical protein GY865_06245 [candidate division Zixibacteria bacterium]|nr:hypothetical protein [candidate division Zixibacteria bacterium]
MKKSLLITTTILVILTSIPCLATEVAPNAGIGSQIGLTTHDEQHPARMARQIAWRDTDEVHFTWNKGNSYPLGISVTSYQVWDTQWGYLQWDPNNNYGGNDLHSPGERSLFPGIDIFKSAVGPVALISNSHEPDGQSPFNYYTTFWPDINPMLGMFFYKSTVPVELLENTQCDNEDYRWPYMSFQLYDNGAVEDTIIHILAKENCGGGSVGGHYPAELRYFRRTGGHHPETPSLSWDPHKIIDVISGTGYVVEASNDVNTGKVGIAWIGHWPDAPGHRESSTPIAFATVKQQSCNDVYIKTSDDGGANWNTTYNITKNDSLGSGWVPHSDISAIIDTDGRLHVVYAARKYVNSNGEPKQFAEMLQWPQFPMASRVLHWSDEGEPVGPALDDNYISVVKDMNLLWDNYPDVCTGGLWSSMSLTKPMISQCDDKLYVLFSQYQDPLNGVMDNCHISRYNGSYNDGAANGTLHLSTSSMTNGGLNWDPARMLTSFTPRCDTGHTYDPNSPVDLDAITVCHNHGWPSMARYGMRPEIDSDFENAVVVNDLGWSQTESPDYFLDVLYVDDLYPGNFINYFEAEGMWTINPVKWLRVPCVDEEVGSILSPSLLEINEPDYDGSPGSEITYTVTVENIGNMPMDIVITTDEIDNVDSAIDGWLYVDLNGYDDPLSHIPPNNTHDFYVIVNHNGIVDVPYVPTTLQGSVTFSTPSRGILYELPVEHAISEPAYICGDVNDDTNIDILDIVFLINYKYKGGPAPEPLESADVNFDTNIDILDIVYLINYKYKGGAEPACQ